MGTAVRAVWEDSAHLSGWRYKHEVEQASKDTAKIYSLGFVVRSVKNSLLLSSTLSEGGIGALGIVQIPWNSIVEIQKLGENLDLKKG